MRNARIALCILATCLGVSTTNARQAPDMRDVSAWCAAGKIAGGNARFSVAKSASNASDDVDVTYYHLNLDLDRARSPVLVGSVRVDGRALGDVSGLSLDLFDGMTVDSVTTLAGTRLNFSHENNVVTAGFPASIPRGQQISAVIYYRGNPRTKNFGSFAWGHSPSGQPYLWTLSEPYNAMEWWPNKDNPADKADSVRVTVRMPSNMRVGSNGVLENESNNGDGTTTYDWVHRYPISTYLVSVSAGEYDVFNQTYVRPDSLAQEFGPLSLPIVDYAYPGDNAFEGIDNPIPNGWKRVLEVLPVFEYWFGPYPFPDEKYGHSKVTFGGGMEHQTMSSLGGIGLGLVAHELGHMWYGDAVTNRSWRDLWLHEGFATLSEMLFWESDPDQFGDSWRDSFFGVGGSGGYFDKALRAQGTLVLEDTTNVNDMFAGERIYAKGYMVLRMLRKVVGDEHFRAILRGFAMDPALRLGTATTADFERVAERVYGRSLGSFFEQWVYTGTGFPRYSISWSQTPGNGPVTISLELRQIQDGTTTFEMPVEVEFETDIGPVRVVLDNSGRTQSYSIPLERRAHSAQIDPDRWILRDPDVTLVSTEGATGIPTHSNPSVDLYPNPARNGLTIQIQSNSGGRRRIRLVSVTGQVVLEQRVQSALPGASSVYVTLPRRMASGLYFLEVLIDGRVTRSTVTVLR